MRRLEKGSSTGAMSNCQLQFPLTSHADDISAELRLPHRPRCRRQVQGLVELQELPPATRECSQLGHPTNPATHS